MTADFFDQVEKPLSPNLPTEKTRSLDIGCGPAPDLPDADVRVGLDIDLNALRRNHARYPHACFVCGDGERLPFCDAAFDSAVSRVALPLMNLNAAIPEVSRVLKPEAHFRMNLHNFGFAWRDLLRRVRTGRPRAAIGGLWAIANGCIFHYFGRTFRLPFSRRFYDSFQSYSSMKRILQRHGFGGPIVAAYVITAEKVEEAAEPER